MTGFFRAIESPQNASAKEWLSLTESRGIKKHGRFLLAGRKTVPEALSQYPDQFEAVLVTDPEQVAAWTIPSHIDRYRLSRTIFDELDVSGTGFPLLLGRVPDMKSADLTQAPRGLELICALGDPNNLGAVLRSAAAFGVSRVILMEDAAHPFHPKCLRAAANAQFALELCRGPKWDGLQDVAGDIIALDGTGESMRDFRWPQHLRIVLGEEGRGLPASLKLKRLAIPMTDAVESLNATVAASIAMHSYFIRKS